MLTANQIRSQFIRFFEERGHVFVPSWPVVPAGDPTLMFTNAGMNQFKDIFLGLRAPDHPRAVNSQRCIRVSGKHNDLEEVGLDTYHHTFFEMLGNWSFGDYFKAEAIQWAWQLLTDVYQIPPERLWVTVFAGDQQDGSAPDTESQTLWPKVTGIPKERVLQFVKKENFWEMGSTGPCGPCSEIHIDLGPERCNKAGIPGHVCRVNGDCGRFIELWNLVFIQFNRQQDGTLVPLKANHVDTGAGLERLCAVLQGRSSNYDTDLFSPIIEAIGQLTGRQYKGQLGDQVDNAFRVIADHIRALTFAIADGVIPSNEGRGYVVRRILRRAWRFGRILQMREPFLYKLVPAVVQTLSEAFPEPLKRAGFVCEVIEAEEASFCRTLDRGLELFAQAAARARQSDGVISGDDAFLLYDTYGFPIDLTGLLAREQDLKVDQAGFEALMEQQRSRARAAAKASDLATQLAGCRLPVTDDSLKYQADTCQARILGWLDQQGLHQEGILDRTDQQVGLVLDKTCFYAEAGGQVGDKGLIKGDGLEFVVEGTERIADCIIHKGKLISGQISIGQIVTATVDAGRQQTKKNHTATHLLQWALQQVLGSHVHQQGSLVCPDYLRFDFIYQKALTKEQLEQVEGLVQEKIEQDLPVVCEVLPIEKARHLGAMALFGEKYGSHVRVLGIGATKLEQAFSREFCGGTHVQRTGQIGGFAIIKEESVSAGVRRITALTGHCLMQYLLERRRIVEELTGMLQVRSDQIVARVAKLIEDNKRLSKQLKAGHPKSQDALAQARQFLEQAKMVGNTAIVTGLLPDVSIDQARAAIDMVRNKAKSAAVVFGLDEDTKATVLIGLTDDLVAKGLDAGRLARAIAPLIQGGGGGRPHLAQAGGKDPKGIEEALSKASQMISQALAG
ncbi:MAG: alanine--tRNA ligase [Sedimentisphaerales bacterium]|nr:alanine--tRNA ligase [Sedimentisphaerales bacterium]